MGDAVKMGADASPVPLRCVDDFVGRNEALVADAHAQGYGTLAYLLETARIEARISEAQKLKIFYKVAMATRFQQP